jgi:pyruvate dehydrogenase E1 component alpha subunit
MRPIKGYKKDFLLAILEEMLLTRRFEEKAGQMYGLKKIGGFCHLYNGQEAVSAGIAAATKRGEDAFLLVTGIMGMRSLGVSPPTL